LFYAKAIYSGKYCKWDGKGVLFGTGVIKALQLKDVTIWYITLIHIVVVGIAYSHSHSNDACTNKESKQTGETSEACNNL
jgi:hypothetical protein